MSPLMVVADDEGNLFEHPDLEMVGALGAEPVAPDPYELSPLPPGSTFFTIPASTPVGGDPQEDTLVSVEEADWGDGPVALQAACTFPSPGWMRTLLPFAERDAGAQALPLWAYTALGFDEESGGFVCAAVQVDDPPRNAGRGCRFAGDAPPIIEPGIIGVDLDEQFGVAGRGLGK